MSALLEDVFYLAETIGARGTGTPGEAAAADYVSQRLQELGIKPERFSFRAVPSQNVFPLATSTMALLATLIYPLGNTFTRWLASLLCLAASWSLWQTIRNDYNPLSVLLPKTSSQNIEARLAPKEEVRQRAVLLAHLDTNRCRFVWQSNSSGILTPMTWLTLIIPLCMSALYLIGAITMQRLWWEFSLPLAAYQIGTLVTLIKDDRLPYSPGAHDNAASVAVSLEVARRIAAGNFLSHTEVWFVFDGAEETDHAGVFDLLRRHGKELRQAIFFGLEGLGSGELVYLTRQGVVAYYRPDPGVLALVESIAARHAEFHLHPGQMVMEDDVRALRQRGYRAMCIAAMDVQRNTLPYWHRLDDTPQHVSEETMSRAVDILCAILQEFDHREA